MVVERALLILLVALCLLAASVGSVVSGVPFDRQAADEVPASQQAPKDAPEQSAPRSPTDAHEESDRGGRPDRRQRIRDGGIEDVLQQKPRRLPA